jgi:signal transduction histidine kinase
MAATAVIMLAALLVFVRMRRVEQRRMAEAEFSRRLLVQREEERKRVAADLHDGLGQSLLVIKNRALLAAEGEPAFTPAARQLGEISATASIALEEVRRIAYNLHPAELDHLGVTRAIEAMLRRIGDASPILISSNLDPLDGRLSKEEEVNVFRIVQEAMANVVRHSGATAAVVNITGDGPRLSIRVHDNGVGLPPTAAARAQSGLGLGSIAARARMLGGTCHIASSAGEGTTVTVEIDARSAS